MFNYKFLNIKTEIKHNFSSKFFPTTFNSFASVKKEHIDSQESESSLALCKREREGEGGSLVVVTQRSALRVGRGRRGGSRLLPRENHLTKSVS